MRYISAALLAEGATDNRFLELVLYRLLESLLLDLAVENYELPDVVSLAPMQGSVTAAEAAVKVSEVAGYQEIVFLHKDADGRKASSDLDAWFDEVESSHEQANMIRVIPVRETEAWMLADGDAIRRVLGVTWTDNKMNLPKSPKEVEKVADPKQLVERLESSVSGPRVDMYARLGSLVRLEALRGVPAFSDVATRVQGLLSDTGVITS